MGSPCPGSRGPTGAWARSGPNYTDTVQAHDDSDRVGRNAARNLVRVARALAAAGRFPPQES